MNEQFLSEFVVKLSNKVDEETLAMIKAELAVHMNDYTVTKRDTEIIPYDYMPDCVKIYLVSRKIEGVKQSSLNLYHTRLKKFFETVQRRIEDITANDIRVFLYTLQQSANPQSNRTLDGTRSIISTFFKWANAEGYIKNDPCASIKPIKYNRNPREPLNSVELELVRNACDNIRDRAMIEFFYSTGCRVSELINLKISDVDFTNNEVMLFGKGEKYRKSYLTPKAMMYLKNYLDSRTDDKPHLFVYARSPYEPISRHGVEAMFRRLGEKSGINRRLFPHLIRHTTATDCLTKGMDVTEIQKMLGHENVSTTMIYAKTLDKDVKHKHEKCIA